MDIYTKKYSFRNKHTTFSDISVINIVVVSFIGGGNQSTRREPPTCRKSLINFITYVVSSTPRLSGIPTHNVSGDMHGYHSYLLIQLP